MQRENVRIPSLPPHRPLPSSQCRALGHMTVRAVPVGELAEARQEADSVVDRGERFRRLRLRFLGPGLEYPRHLAGIGRETTIPLLDRLEVSDQDLCEILLQVAVPFAFVLLLQRVDRLAARNGV